MTETPLHRAILDTNVLHPAGMRDILLQLGADGLIEPKWSAEIGRELLTSLRRRRPDIEPERLDRTWAEMNHYFPNAQITGYEEHINQLQLPDPDDLHVLAAAIVGDCDVIVTRNLRDFPVNVVAAYGVSVLHPDNFMRNLLSVRTYEFCDAVRKLRLRLRRPPYSVEQYLEHLERDELGATVALLHQHAHRL